MHPGRDEKVLTAWNGLMLAAFAEAARALDRDDYRQVAERNAGFPPERAETGERSSAAHVEIDLNRPKDLARPSSTATWKTMLIS